MPELLVVEVHSIGSVLDCCMGGMLVELLGLLDVCIHSVLLCIDTC